MIRKRLESSASTRYAILENCSCSSCSSSDEEIEDDVNLCFTVRTLSGQSPPLLPLRGEHVSLGVETIYKCEGSSSASLTRAPSRDSNRESAISYEDYSCCNSFSYHSCGENRDPWMMSRNNANTNKLKYPTEPNASNFNKSKEQHRHFSSQEQHSSSSAPRAKARRRAVVAQKLQRHARGLLSPFFPSVIRKAHSGTAVSVLSEFEEDEEEKFDRAREFLWLDGNGSNEAVEILNHSNDEDEHDLQDVTCPRKSHDDDESHHYEPHEDVGDNESYEDILAAGGWDKEDHVTLHKEEILSDTKTEVTALSHSTATSSSNSHPEQQSQQSHHNRRKRCYTMDSRSTRLNGLDYVSSLSSLSLPSATMPQDALLQQQTLAEPGSAVFDLCLVKATASQQMHHSYHSPAQDASSADNLYFSSLSSSSGASFSTLSISSAPTSTCSTISVSSAYSSKQTTASYTDFDALWESRDLHNDESNVTSTHISNTTVAATPTPQDAVQDKEKTLIDTVEHSLHNQKLSNNLSKADRYESTPRLLLPCDDYQILENTQTKCALHLQTLARAYLKRKHTTTTKSATLIQTLTRQYIAQKRYQQHKACICIQALVRGYLATKLYTAWKTLILYHTFCIRIQKIVRGYLVRKYQWKIHAAACCIQSVWRGHFAQQEYERGVFVMSMIPTVIKIQRALRYLLAKKKQYKIQKAASSIQRSWRCHFMQCQYNKLQNSQMSCIIKIQSVMRIFLTRRIILKHNAACSIQIVWRCYKAKSLHRTLQMAKIKSISKIQSAIRGYLSRAYYATYCTSVLIAAVSIQSSWRRHYIQRHYKMFRTTRIKYIAIARSVSLAFSLRRRYLKYDEAVRCIQRAWKCSPLAQSLVSRRTLSPAAVQLQSMMRGFLERMHQRRYHRAATCIQCVWRSYIVHKKYKAFCISRMCRDVRLQYLASNDLIRQYQIRLDTASCDTQGACRLSSLVQYHNEVPRNNQICHIVQIQCWMRGFLERLHQARYHRAAKCIQRLWRHCKAPVYIKECQDLWKCIYKIQSVRKSVQAHSQLVNGADSALSKYSTTNCIEGAQGKVRMQDMSSEVCTIERPLKDSLSTQHRLLNLRAKKRALEQKRLVLEQRIWAQMDRRNSNREEVRVEAREEVDTSYTLYTDPHI
mmetsp:Transcript_23237/g.34123  ORF Transcript_23237/g.34123 Transcript_23237/m.34123 type:complete len:1150 (-) Transcript_23237:42-3491(-)